MNKKQQIGGLVNTLSLFEKSLITIGHRTFNYVSDTPDKLWPYWIHKQLFNDSTLYDVSNHLQCLNNTRYRNWVVLSEPFIDEMVAVDSSGLTHIKDKSFSTHFVIYHNDTLYTANVASKISQLFNPKSSILRTILTFDLFEVQYDIFFKVSSNTFHLAFQKYSIKNKSSENLKFSFLFLISPYNFEGLTNIKKIEFIRNNTFMINKSIGLICPEKPNNIVCINHDDGTFPNLVSKIEMILQSDCVDKLASSYAEYKISLKKDEEKDLHFLLPFNNTPFKAKLFEKKVNFNDLDLECSFYENLNFNKQLKLKTDGIEKQSKSRLKLTLPDQELNRLFEQNSTFLTSFIGKKSIQSGFYSEFFTHKLYESQLLLSLVKLGFDFNTLDYMPSERKFNDIKKQLDSNTIEIDGLLRWVYNYLIIFDYLPVTTNVDTHLKQFITLYTYILNLKRHIFNSISTQKLLRPRKSIYNKKDTHYLSDNMWYLIVGKKLKEHMLKLDIPLNTELKWALNQLPSHLEDFIKTYSKKQFSNDILPVSSISNKSIKLFDTLESVSKIDQFKKDFSLHVKNTEDYIESHLLNKHLLLSVANPSGYIVEQNFRLANYYSKFSSKKAYSTVKHIAKLASSAGTWPDCIHPVSLGGSFREGHCPTSSALYIETILNLIFNDKTLNYLEFFSGMPEKWFLNEDSELALDNAPSRYGRFSFSLKPKDGIVEFNFKHSFHSKPHYFLFNLPNFVKSVTFNDRSLAKKGSTLKIPFNITSIQFNLNEQIKN